MAMGYDELGPCLPRKAQATMAGPGEMLTTKEDTVQVLAGALRMLQTRVEDLEKRLEPILVSVAVPPTAGGNSVPQPNEPMSARRSALLGIADELRFSAERLGSILNRIDL
jgi:hypothetical protein